MGALVWRVWQWIAAVTADWVLQVVAWVGAGKVVVDGWRLIE